MLKRLFFRANLKDKNDVVQLGREPVPEEQANLVSSMLANGSGMHAPVLDIDFHAELIPSSTPGKFHLYLDRPMTWERYSFLLHALHYCGVIERGYLEMSLARKATFLRKPGVKKEPDDINSAGFSNVGDLLWAKDPAS